MASQGDRLPCPPRQDPTWVPFSGPGKPHCLPGLSCLHVNSHLPWAPGGEPADFPQDADEIDDCPPLCHE